MADRNAAGEGEDVTDALPSGPEVADITGAQVRRTLEKLSVEETQEKTPATGLPEPSSVGNTMSGSTISVHSQYNPQKLQEPPNSLETAPVSTMASVHGQESLQSQTSLQNGKEGKQQRTTKDQTEPSGLHQDLSHMYNMNHPRRGLAIVINNKDFDKKTKQKVRTGTDIDADSLFKQLTNLDFDVQMNDNLSCKEMKSVLQEAGAADHSDADCVLVAILSHGEEKKVYGTDGMVDIADLAEYFNGVNCKSLIGKPKIFIIQACQGSKMMDGVDMPDAVGFYSTEQDLLSMPPQTQTLPSEADFLYFYSSTPGYFAWRNQAKGSWSIQSLCAVLKEHGKSGMEIMQILTRVNRTVATQFESHTKDKKTDHKKQMPCIMSMLTKELYFTPKNLEGPMKS